MSNPVAPEPLVRLLGLCKRFGAQWALDQINLDIYPGEGVALLGAAGAGKSTLVNILSGILAPDAGELWVDGQRQRFTSPLSARRVGIVAVHQQPDDAIAPGLSVAENLLLDELGQPDVDFLLNRKSLLQRAEAIAAGLGLDLPLQYPVERLGQADRQLLVLARAFALQPRLLILDEPTAALPEPDTERLLGLIDSQRAQGVAILYISQRLSDLQRVTNRAIVLQEGRLTSDLNTRHLPSAAYTLFGDVAEHSAITPDKALPVPFLERFTRAGFIRNRAEGRAVQAQVRGLPVHKTSSLLNDEAESS
ncbi:MULTISPECIES: ATP-binding cassette domain-containing protein [Pseudomonas]|uniref:ATP-binding cassette domain-containing protein n=1 Tax=Pseudomonas tritici TaxID=2745518 RepID=A0A8H9Z0I4_9PSED|nr:MULTISPECIES: ATP-binding cassette domain-containing protein [Pseudomonas]MBP2873498.1 sugar ABC transporter ATP-binding protein [Pseudomonas sp. SWRI144]MBW8127409.1 ATP-binding cassette domain-containing protein [Pseudomonas sp. LAP_36]MBW8139185.1 ATP-binding cassette domain-containing protein [Pseudomonas sp. PAMC 26818]QXH82030.1 ATP-binding cassette domain-containing protein [Pseudomonas tritici]CRM32131.1 Ribose import ATP-binding protein RbsA [Pseudomonas sp. 24 E 1]